MTRNDEHLLAALMTGTLSHEDHRAMTARMADDAELREVMAMAFQALEAVEQGADAHFHGADSASRAA